jgi:imidazolonepropionase
MSLLIRNARLLTLAGGARPRRGPALRDLSVIDRGDVLVAEGKVAATGPKLDPPEGAEVIDANGRVLMPGFIDCHTRACWAGSRLDEWEQRLRGVSMAEILKAGGGLPATVRAVRAETKKQLAASLKPRLEAMLREGTTTVEVRNGYGLMVEEELKMLRGIVRAAHEWPGTVVPTALLGSAFEGEPEEHVKMVVREMLWAVSREFPGIAVAACCEQGGWPVEACVRLLERAQKLLHPLRVQADQFHPLGMLTEAIRLDARSADQLEASTKDGLLELAKSRTAGVILSCVSLEHNQRFARAGFFADAGGIVALGTGCQPGAPGHSMPCAIALAVRFCGLTPAEAITAATVNAAAVLGLNDRGTIEPGSRADLILLRHRDERELAHEAGGNPVDLVVCNGKCVK